MKAHKKDYDTPIKIPETLAVIGGGNVAMDVARSAIRIGCKKVLVVYRKTEKEMPARKDEIKHAKEEGVEFVFLKTPLEFVSEGGVLKSLKCAEVQIKESSENGKNLFAITEDKKSEIKIDEVVVAIGNAANKIIFESEKSLDFKENGCILTDDNTKTSRKFVYAGGDAVTGAETVILAMGAGKLAAKQIDKDLS